MSNFGNQILKIQKVTAKKFEKKIFKNCFPIDLFNYDSQVYLNFFFRTLSRHHFEIFFFVFFKTGRNILCFVHSNWLSLFLFIFASETT